MTALTQEETTEGQYEQVQRVVADAVRKALKPLGKSGTQRVHSRGNELISSIAKIIADLAVSDQYADEVVASSYTYPSNYAPKPIGEQIQTLATLFGLDPAKAFAYTENLPELPQGAESWFAIPRWEAVAPTYGETVEKVLSLIAKSRKLKNWREGKLNERYLRQSERTKMMFNTLAEGQEGDILIIPAQFGLRHRGESVRRARETFWDNEFGLGVFAIGCMLLTHPEREVGWEQLHIDGAGDEYSPFAVGQFGSSLSFYWHDGRLEFDDYWVNNADERYGSVSGFLLQG